MPVVIITRAPALPPDQRGELARRADLFGDPPEGLLLHTRSEVGDETQLSVEVWESTEHQQRFVRDRMLPIARGIASEAGLSHEVSAETLTTLAVIQPAVITRAVDDFGNEVRKSTSC